ncbi:hypothetical protein ACNZ70_003804 [Vibrio mimicus]
MCGLCGMLNVEEHWLVANSIESSKRGDVRLRLRRERINVINHWLASTNIKVSDFYGSAYVLANLTGRQELISDIGQLWKTVDSMSNCNIDPLDESYLALIESKK